MNFHHLDRNTLLLQNNFGLWEPANNEIIPHGNSIS